MPWLVFEKFGQSKPLPSNSTKTVQFRRYFLDSSFTTGNATEGIMGGGFNPMEYFEGSNFNPTNKTLTEGVTPDATALESADYEATLVQYGDRVVISDVVMDTHEDPILKEAVDILGEQAAILIEKTRYNTLKAGTTVFYSNGSARASVNTVYALLDQRKVTRFLKRQLGKQITSIAKSTPSYGTEAIAASFVAICHPDMEPDLRAITGFVPVEKYGQMPAWENELGKIEDVRYITSTIIEPFAAGGATGGSNVLEGAGSKANVYPIIFLARDAYGIVAFKGANAMTPMVVNPHASDSDPLAQRGHVGWKGYSATIILNDFWMARCEVAVSDLTA
jgi:N4-gp56 family major capsid protein